MRVEWLFLRWLIVIGLLAFGAIYVQSWQQSRTKIGYETVPLVQGTSSSALPVIGVMIEPDRRNVYAVVGEPAEAFVRGNLDGRNSCVMIH